MPRYTRTASSGGDDDRDNDRDNDRDDDSDDDREYERGFSGGTITINDPDLPLGNLPPGGGLVTIIDPKLPLGNLPKFGGNSRILAMIGGLAIVGSVVLRRKKEEDSDQE